MKTLILFFIFVLTSLLPKVEASQFNHSDKIFKIVVLDSGLDLNDPRFEPYLCHEGHKDFTDQGIQDEDGHGTHVSGLIVDNAGSYGYCLIIVRYFDKNGKSLKYFEALDYASDLNPDIVNISGGGPGYYAEEEYIIKSHPKVKYFVAAGNEGTDLGLKPFYPAALPEKNITTIGNLKEENKRNGNSNFGAAVKVWEIGTHLQSTLPYNQWGYMTGTSQATAVYTGKYIHEKIHSAVCN